MGVIAKPKAMIQASVSTIEAACVQSGSAVF